MKQKLLKKSSLLRGLLSLLLLVTMVGNAWGETYTIDFESATTAYTDWTFTNMTSQQTNTNVTAHGGSYIGTTGGKATASIVTTNAIANPTSITFYVSRASTNTTSSNWIVQTSSDNTTWTDVKTQSATSMTKGTWVEVTQDLTSYSNVYVRVYYSGSTALRTIDDLTLTYTPAGGKTTLKAPTNLSSTNVSDNSASLSWDAVTNASSYTLKIGETEYTNVTSPYTVTGLTASTEYTWTVKAVGDGTNYETSAYAVDATFTTLSDTKHNVIWSVNGTTTSTEVSEGADITFSDPSETTISGKKFMGWITEAISGTQTEAPTFVTSATMGTSDVTYYAVYAKVSGTDPVETTMTLSEGTNTGSETSSVNTWSLSDVISISQACGTTPSGKTQTNPNSSYISSPRWYSYNNITFTPSANIAKVTVTATSNSYASALQSSTYTNATAKLTTEGGTVVDIVPTNGNSEFSVVMGGQCRISAISVTVAGTISYSEYCTSVADKTLNGITISGTPAEFWKNGTFNHTGMTVTANWSDGDEDVTSQATFSTPDMTSAGTKTITVTYSTASKTYDITVKTIENTQETAYTTSEAIAFIDAGNDLSTKVYVKGTISKVASFDSENGTLTYWLDDDAYEVYAGLNNNGEKFTSLDVIKQNGTVVVYGTIKKFGSTYETNSNNWLVSYTAPAIERNTATLTFGTYKSSMRAGNTDEFTATYNGDGELKVSSSNESIAEAVITEGTVTINAKATGTATIKVYAEQTDNYTAVEKSYTLTVLEAITPAEIPFYFDGGKSDATAAKGMDYSGLGPDYTASPLLKFDDTGDCLIIKTASEAKSLVYTVKGNSFSGGTFDVQESADGKTYTSLRSYTELANTTTEVCSLGTDTRFVKFVYTNRSAGNVALGNIGITNETSTTITVSDAGYATYYNSVYPYTMPEGLTGYIFSSTGKNIVETYDSNDNKVVPAGEALVLKGDAKTYSLVYSSSSATKSGKNALLGTDTETALTADDNYYFYGLSLNSENETSSIGFYWMNETGASFTNGAHKAYLKLTKPSNPVKGFAFNMNDETAISQIVNKENTSGAIYNLSGQRISRMQKGINIINGKKVIK